MVSVDLQRPGQSHEACFFDSAIPVETVSTNDLFVDYFKSPAAGLVSPVVVVSPNTEFVKKAKRFQRKLKSQSDLAVVDYAAFLEEDWSDLPYLSSTGKFIDLGAAGVAYCCCW